MSYIGCACSYGHAKDEEEEESKEAQEEI